MAPLNHKVDGVEVLVVLTFTVLVFGLGMTCHRRQAVHLHCKVVSSSAVQWRAECENEEGMAVLCVRGHRVLIMPHLRNRGHSWTYGFVIGSGQQVVSCGIIITSRLECGCY
jgi:hypothetical protein